MKFAIFGNIYQAKKSSYAEQLFKLLTQHNAQICICQEFYNFLTETLHLVLPPVELFNDDDFEADIVISLGGDGTFLKAASRVGKHSYLRNQYWPSGIFGRHFTRRDGKHP